jgi:hypothetical protein
MSFRSLSVERKKKKPIIRKLSPEQAYQIEPVSKRSLQIDQTYDSLRKKNENYMKLKRMQIDTLN